MSKEYTGLLVAKVRKKEIAKKYPHWVREVQGYYFLTDEAKEILKKYLIEIIIKQARAKNYYLYEDVELYENLHYFACFALGYPRNIGGLRKLKPKPINREEFMKKVEEEIAKLNLMAVDETGEITVATHNSLTPSTNDNR